MAEASEEDPIQRNVTLTLSKKVDGNFIATADNAMFDMVFSELNPFHFSFNIVHKDY